MISSLTNDGTFPDRPPESRNRGMVNRFKVNEEKRNIARTHSSHIFVRPKKCDYLGKCDDLGDM